jgi:hypothetical protein
MRLDGNAAAGLLQDMFAPEVTTLRGRCAACGAVDEIGAQHLYMYPRAPGAVLRCRSCESVLLVVTRHARRLRVGPQGYAWLETDTAASPA